MNRTEHIEQVESFARTQLANLERYPRLLRGSGHLKEADRAEREVARVRRRAERVLAALPAKLDASDARLAASVDELVAALERIVIED
jgi:hypothetical protein